MKEKTEKKKTPYEKGLHKLLLYAISQIHFSMAGDSKEAELLRRELDIIGNENQVAYKQVNIDAEIKSKAENMIADRKFALEKDMQNRSAKLEQMYKATHQFIQMVENQN